MKIIKQLSFKWLSLSFVIYSIGIYQCKNNFCISGFIGFVLLNVIFSICIETVLSKIKLIHNNKIIGVLLIATSLIFTSLSFINPKFAGTTIVVDITSIIMVLFSILMCLKRKSTLDKKIIAFMLFLAFVFFIACFNNGFGSFSADSYSYYEIAKSFDNEFGKVNTIRQYTVDTDLNISFPYFYPLCCYIVNKVTNLGILSGVLLNLYFFISTIVALLYISKKFTCTIKYGALVIFALTTSPSYIDEVMSARAIPLTLLISFFVFYILYILYYLGKNNIYNYIILGVLTGCAVSTRFDAIVIAFISSILIVIFDKKKFISLLLYGIPFIALISPWIIYSITNFNTIWISDNSGTAFLVNVSIPSEIRLPNKTLTLFNAPTEWIDSLFSKRSRIIFKLGVCSIAADIFIFLSLMKIVKAFITKQISNKNKVFFLIIVLFALVKTLLYILVGYADTRYHLETVLIVLFSFFIILSNEEPALKSNKIYNIITIITLMISLPISVMLFSLEYSFNCKNITENNFQDAGTISEKLVNLDKELNQYQINKNNRLMIHGSDSFVFGAFTDWKVYVPPGKFDEEKYTYAFNNYISAKYILVPKEQNDIKYMDWLNSDYNEIALRDFHLYIKKDS